MKKIISLALLAFAALPTMAQETQYSVTATGAEAGKVYLHNVNGRSETIDSVVVVNGTFTFKGSQPANAFLQISFEKRGTQDVAFLNDGTPIVIDLQKQTLKGSALNEKFFQYQLSERTFDDRMQALYTEYTTLNGKDDEASQARIKAIREEFGTVQDEYEAHILQLIRDNKDNLIPAYTGYINAVCMGFDYETLKGILDETAAYYNHPSLASAKRALAGLEKRRAGKQFSELTMNDPEGKEVRLSQYVGKGKYVLVDFWASWCGPCRAEMPTVVKSYELYKAKGYEIVGVSFDQKAEAWKKALTDLNMTWPQMSDLKGWQCAAHEVYGVNSIPSNILVDPQGVIVASDLRGEELLEKLAELLDK